jgi:hypothetical protein
MVKTVVGARGIAPRVNNTLISIITDKGEQHMSTEQNKALVHRFFEEFSTTVVDELYIPDYTHHDPGLPPARLTNNSLPCSAPASLI